MTDQDPRPDRLAVEEDEYPLAPAEDLPRRPEPPLPSGPLLDAAQSEDREGYQFTLAELILLTSATALFLSLVASIARWLPGSLGLNGFAGLLGLGALASMIIIALYPPRRPIVLIGWWTLVVLYVICCLIAAVAGK
jgi:hypothetical protein